MIKLSFTLWIYYLFSALYMGWKFIEEAFNFALCQSSFLIEAGEQCVFRCKYFISYRCIGLTEFLIITW